VINTPAALRRQLIDTVTRPQFDITPMALGISCGGADEAGNFNGRKYFRQIVPAGTSLVADKTCADEFVNFKGSTSVTLEIYEGCGDGTTIDSSRHKYLGKLRLAGFPPDQQVPFFLRFKVDLSGLLYVMAVGPDRQEKELHVHTTMTVTEEQLNTMLAEHVGVVDVIYDAHRMLAVQTSLKVLCDRCAAFAAEDVSRVRAALNNPGTTFASLAGMCAMLEELLVESHNARLSELADLAEKELEDEEPDKKRRRL
jgi:hypothetical protein